MTPFIFIFLASLSVATCAVGYALWRGPTWVRVITILCAGVGLYHAQWYGRALINARWVDDTRSLYQQDKVLEAIKAGKTKIPLAETTNFEWTAVCHVWAEPPYSPAFTDELKHEVFGTTRIPFFDSGKDGEYFVLVYATPAGPYIMEPEWQGRFTREFQKRHMGKYYRQKLGGNGYWIEDRMNERKDNSWNGICFKPEDIWFEISPEPPWTDDIPASAEQIRKQTKRP